MASKSAIRHFWAKRLAELGKFDSEWEALEGDYCFACGMIDREENKTWTQRCHIQALCNKGSNKAENLHLLCCGCHKDSEYLEGDAYWTWFNKRTNLAGIISCAMQTPAGRRYLLEKMNVV